MPAARQALGTASKRDADLACLMVAAQAGDRTAYQLLLRACVPVAAGIARRQGVAAAQIDDVVQDTLLTVHRVRATYDPRRPFLPWLCAIAHRRGIDMLRRQKSLAARDWAGHLFDAAQADPGPLAPDLLERSDRARQLGAAIQALPNRQREAVQLLGLMEQTLAEASGMTGRSTGALKVNLHRGLNALRGMLAAQHEARA